MRLKEIKPGMVIHCKNDDEKKALLEEAERLGYVWYRTKDMPTDYISSDGNTIYFFDAGTTPLSVDYKYITYSCSTNDVTTEFSDLILHKLTAAEAIKINTELCAGTCEECPLYNVDGYSDCDELCIKNPEKAVEILAQWKSNHEKKEPEIETVDICRIIEIQPDGRKRCVHEEDISDGELMYSGDAVENCRYILKNYCKEHYGEFIAVHEVVSRVKQ